MSWLGVDTGASDVGGVPSEEVRGGDRAPVGGGRGGRGKGPAPRPPPLEAKDLDGLRVETWLLEVRLVLSGVQLQIED